MTNHIRLFSILINRITLTIFTIRPPLNFVSNPRNRVCTRIKNFVETRGKNHLFICWRWQRVIRRKGNKLMIMVRNGVSSGFRSLITWWTATGTKGRITSRSIGRPERSSRRWCSIARSKERTRWRWRPGTVHLPPGPTATASPIPVWAHLHFPISPHAFDPVRTVPKICWEEGKKRIRESCSRVFRKKKIGWISELFRTQDGRVFDGGLEAIR